MIQRRSTDGGWDVSVGFLVAMAAVLVVFIAAIITAVQGAGVVRSVAVAVAAITSLYGAWVGVLTISVRSIVKMIKR